MLLLAVLLTPAAVARPDDRVPGTDWRLGEPRDWSAEETALLGRVAEGLPRAWVAPVPPVILDRAEAGPLPDDLTTPHVLVHRRGQHLTVALGGLAERVEEWIEAHPDTREEPGALTERLVRRQLGHALTHVIDRGWSSDPAWTGLSGWRAVMPWLPPAETRPWAFASVHGMAGAAEDLATLAERVWIVGSLPGESTHHPQCRVPTKWRQVERFFQEESEVTADCPRLEDTDLDPGRVASVELVYVRGAASSPASLAGHSLIAVEYAPDSRGVIRREAYALVALTGGQDSGLGYVVRGLFGGFPSQVVREPWDAVAFRYGTEEDRDLLRFPLVLDQDQERVVLGRLDELRRGWRRPYLYLTRNCGELPRELAEALNGGPIPLPSSATPDALFGWFHRSGWLGEQVVGTVEERSLGARAAVAVRLREADVEATLATVDGQRAARVRDALGATESGSDARRAEGYRALAAAAQAPVDPAVAAMVDRYLAWSDPWERHRLRGRDVAPDGPAALEALRSAKADNRARAAEAGVDLVLQDPRAHVEEELAKEPPDRGSDHSPLRRIEVWGGSMWTNGQLVPSIAASTRLYAVDLGEARRFPVTPGLFGRLLELEVEARLGEAQDLVTRWRSADLLYVRGLRPAGNPGMYVSFPATTRIRSETSHGETTWLEAGPVVELVQADRHRIHLLLRAGGAVWSRWQEGEPVTPGLAAPVRLSAFAGSPGHALTALRLDGAWNPSWSGRWRQELEASVHARVGIGEVLGSDLGVVLEHRIRGAAGEDRAGGTDQAARVGLWIERF